MPNELTEEQSKELEELVKEVDVEELSDALWMIREQNKINKQKRVDE